jgi:hypothetical protein
LVILPNGSSFGKIFKRKNNNALTNNTFTIWLFFDITFCGFTMVARLARGAVKKMTGKITKRSNR